jgi:hypothetical protein
MGRSRRLARFALEAKLPSVSGWSPFAHKGLLMTYGPNVRELYRSLARYRPYSAWHQARRSADRGADQILSGAQSQDRQEAGTRNPTDAARARGRGNRVMRAVHQYRVFEQLW